MTNSELVDLLKNLHQTVTNSKDYYKGQYVQDKKDELPKIGLRREVENPITQSRFMDGFNIKVSGNVMVLDYQREITLKETHKSGFKNQLNLVMGDIVKFIKKEYSRLSGGKPLNIKPLTKEPVCDVKYISRVKCWVECQQHFELTDIKVEEEKIDPKNPVPDWVNEVINSK